MAQVIEVPGYGQVEFPDNMSDAQITDAIKKNMPSVNTAPNRNENVNPLLAAGNFAEQNITQPVQNFLTATGQGVTNSGINALNTLSKFAGYPTNIQPVNVANTNNISGTLGNIAGNTAGFFGAGGIAKGIASIPAIAESLVGATNALSKIPYASKVINALTSPIGQRAAGSAAYGASQDTNNPLAGATEGAAASLIPDTLLNGAVGRTINTIKKPFSATTKAEQLLNDLGEGKSVEENSKAVAQKIKNSYEKAKAEGQQLYKNVFDLAGNEKIDENLGPYSSAYKTLGEDIFNDYDKKLRKLHDAYMANPTLENAHNLQSQLGSSIRKLQKKDAKDNLPIAEKNVKESYTDAKKNILQDMTNYLSNKNPIIAEKYNNASQNWLENVVPYLSDPKISKIAKGATTNPGILKNIFNNPEPKIQKIVSDIGESGNKNILYDTLGRIPNLTPESLINGVNKLDASGLESYLTPSIQNQINELQKVMKNRENASKVLGALGVGAAGAGLGHMLPLGPSADILGLIAGLKIGEQPFISDRLKNVLPEAKNALNTKKPKLNEDTKNALRALAVGTATQ
jgi:hypothetical protein